MPAASFRCLPRESCPLLGNVAETLSLLKGSDVCLEDSGSFAPETDQVLRFCTPSCARCWSGSLWKEVLCGWVTAL